MSAHAFLLGGAYLFLPSKVDLDFTERNLFWTKAKKFGFILLKAGIPKIVISFCKKRDNFCSWEQKCLKDIVGLKNLFLRHLVERMGCGGRRVWLFVVLRQEV